MQLTGVGIGRNPAVYLKSGDEIVVSISGLGRLTNRIASPDSQDLTMARLEAMLTPRLPSSQRGVEYIGEKPLHVKRSGDTGGPTAVFIHGLGGSVD